MNPSRPQTMRRLCVLAAAALCILLLTASGGLNAEPLAASGTMEVLRAVGIVTGIVAAGWKVVPWTRDRLRARRDSNAAHAKRRAEVAAGVESLLADMKYVRAELNENGGGSVKDAVLAFRSELALERAARRAAWGQAAYEVQIHADNQLSVLHVTPQWTALTGLSRDEAALEGWARSVHPDDREQVKHSALESLTSGTVFTASYRLRNVRTHQEFTVEHIGTPVLDRKNRVVGFVGVVTPTDCLSKPNWCPLVAQGQSSGVST